MLKCHLSECFESQKRRAWQDLSESQAADFYHIMVSMYSRSMLFYNTHQVHMDMCRSSFYWLYSFSSPYFPTRLNSRKELLLKWRQFSQGDSRQAWFCSFSSTRIFRAKLSTPFVNRLHWNTIDDTEYVASCHSNRLLNSKVEPACLYSDTGHIITWSPTTNLNY